MHFNEGKWLLIYLSVFHQMTAVISDNQLNPGAQITLTQAGLNYASDVALDVMIRTIRGRSIPDQSGIDRLDVGRVKWQVRQMSIVDFTKPSTKVDLVDDAMIWSMSGAGLKTSGQWRYEYSVWRIKVRDSGSFDLVVNGAWVNVKIALKMGQHGSPQVKVLDCQSRIENVDVVFRGGRDWLYNLFSSAIERPIKRELEKAVCEEAIKSIDVSGNEALDTLNLDVPLENGMKIDCGLLSDPVIANGYIMTSHKARAEFPNDTSPIPIPFPPIQLNPASLPQRMITLYISQYTADTIGYLFHKHGQLSYTLTKDDLNSESGKAFLSTSCQSNTCIGSLFPVAATLFPNALIEMNMSTVEPPTLQITSEQAKAKFHGRLEVLGKLPVTPMMKIMALDVRADVYFSVEVEGNFIKAHVERLVPILTIESSLIGTPPADKLNELIQFAANDFIVPQMNEVLSGGFDIPRMEGLGFLNPVLTKVEGGVVLSTDVQYTENANK